MLRQLDLIYWSARLLWWCVEYSLHLTALAALIALLAYLILPINRGRET